MLICTQIIKPHCKSTFLPLMQLMVKLPLAFRQPVNLRLNLLRSNNRRRKLNENLLMHNNVLTGGETEQENQNPHTSESVLTLNIM